MTHASVTAVVDGDGVTITMSGEIDLDNATRVEAQVHDAISNDAKWVVLDVGDVAYIDSVGMRILFALASTLDTLSITLTIVAPPGTAARRVIELSGLDTIAALQP
jgi:anti-anti-sigma factor